MEVEYLGNPQSLDGKTWVQVRMLDGTLGWMLGEFLATVGPAATATATPLP
jgi:ribosomal protein S19